MPYVERDSDTHAIKGLYACEQPGYAEEFLDDDDAEVVAYRNPVIDKSAENFNGLESRRSDALLSGTTDDQIAGLALEIAAIKRKIGLE